MNTIYFLWKVWLRLKTLAQTTENDYAAEVSTAGRIKNNEDIARRIIAEGSDIKSDTILSILNQSDGIIRYYLQQGYSVATNCCKFTPRVSGSFTSSHTRFNRDIHKISVDITPSAEMCEALEQVGVSVLGVKDNSAYITLVTDASTGLADGIITANENIIIEGDNLKIMPQGEPGLGVSFIDRAGDVYAVVAPLKQNNPRKITARVPDLSPGEYILRITTRFSGSPALLREPYMIEYDRALIVLP